MQNNTWSNWIEWGRQNAFPAGLAGSTEVEFKAYDEPSRVIPGFYARDLEWKNIIAYRYKIKEPVKCLDNAWDEPTPEEEEAWQAKDQKQNRSQYSAYFKDVRHIYTIDVYRVVSLFDCEKHGHAISHAAKKLLLTGARTGGKDVETEVREAIDSLHRWLEMREEDARA